MLTHQYGLWQTDMCGPYANRHSKVGETLCVMLKGYSNKIHPLNPWSFTTSWWAVCRYIFGYHRTTTRVWGSVVFIDMCWSFLSMVWRSFHEGYHRIRRSKTFVAGWVTHFGVTAVTTIDRGKQIVFLCLW